MAATLAELATDPIERLDIVAYNTIPFVFSRVLESWDALYDLYSGTFKAHMRSAAQNLNVLHYWGTDRGNIIVTPTRAAGILSFIVKPVAGDTIRLGETDWTFVSASPGTYEILIGANRAATVANAVTKLSASVDVDTAKCTYSQAGTDLNVDYKITGYVGNSFVIASSTDSIKTSADTLRKGGALLSMLASVEEVASFEGDFYYDLRFENELGPQAILFGGEILWKQGVTR